MIEQKKARCGEIYFYDFGKRESTFQTGVKPVVVIQDNRLNEVASTTLIAVIELNARKAYLPTHLYLEGIMGHDDSAMIRLEQVACVDQDDLRDFIGIIDDTVMKHSLRNCLKKVFGIWDYTPQGAADVRCLCPKCLQAYMQTGRYIVRRLDPFSSKKDSCDKCNSLGYDYVLVERKKQDIKQMCKSEIRTLVKEGRNE